MSSLALNSSGTTRETGAERSGAWPWINRRAPFACDASASRGRLFPEPESGTRSPFQRDRDRIIHSAAFRRLKHKTQVFVHHEGDFFRTRLSHTLEVAQITESICRQLGLDEDLAEAVALAHDLGHTPFGHAGEDALIPLMAPHGGFSHNDQTVRILTRLERKYADFDGLNLSWEALEGVAKHNGPLLPLKPGGKLDHTIAAFRSEWDLELDSWPSAEAQVAALADDIAYNNHDLDDGLGARLFGLDELRELPLIGPILAEVEKRHPGLERPRLVHETIRRLINAMVTDLIEESRRRLSEAAPQSADEVRAAGRPLIGFSDEMQQADKALRRFLWDRVYRHYTVNRMTSKARRIVTELFELLMAEPECLSPEWQAQLTAAAALDGESGKARTITDFIAGLTDAAAMDEYRQLFDLTSRTWGTP